MQRGSKSQVAAKLLGVAIFTAALTLIAAGPSFAATGGAPELIAQYLQGRCADLDPDDFASNAAFVDAVVAQSGGFGSPATEQHTIECAETLYWAGKIRDIQPGPVMIAIRRLLRECDASSVAAPRTCGMLRSVMHDAVISNSEPIDPLSSPAVIPLLP